MLLFGVGDFAMTWLWSSAVGEERYLFVSKLSWKDHRNNWYSVSVGRRFPIKARPSGPKMSKSRPEQNLV